MAPAMDSQVRSALPAPGPNHKPSILSIDGGGVRGIIPARILVALEKKINDIEKAKGERRLAEYFDLVAGTSTGGILAALLVTPDKDGKLRSAEEAAKFYMDNAHVIFPPIENTEMIAEDDAVEAFVAEMVPLIQERLSAEGEIRIFDMERKGSMTDEECRELALSIWDWIPARLRKWWRLFMMGFRPKYDGKALTDLADKIFGQKTLGQTFTNLMTTSYEINKRHPLIFSSYQAKAKKLPSDFLVAHACLATSAAPVYLPPRQFKYKDGTVYNLIDGGVAANNPTILALVEMINAYYSKQKETDEKEKQKPMNPAIVLSLGCGQGQVEPYDASESWGAIKWIFGSGKPLISILLEAGPNVTDIAAHILFSKVFQLCESYLRIEKFGLEGDTAELDNARDSNMKKLSEIGNKLLQEKVTYIDITTGQPTPVGDEINDKALDKLAQQLVDERRQRLEAQA